MRSVKRTSRLAKDAIASGAFRTDAATATLLTNLPMRARHGQARSLDLRSLNAPAPIGERSSSLPKR